MVPGAPEDPAARDVDVEVASTQATLEDEVARLRFEVQARNELSACMKPARKQN